MSDHIIRAKFTPDPGYPIDLLKIARDLLAQAEHEAPAIIRAARREAASQISQVRRRAARTAAAAARRAIAAEHAARLAQIETERRRALRQAKGECLNLCLSIAREVIGAEIAARPASLAARIAAALEALTQSRTLKISVHPDDWCAVRRCLTARSRFVLEKDPAIAAGNARLETPGGTVDLDWEAHLASIAEALRQAL